MILPYRQDVYVFPFSPNDIHFILNHYSGNGQMSKACEELSELTQIISKKLSSSIDDKEFRTRLIDEMADVIIMLNQLLYMFDIDEKDDLNVRLGHKMQRQIGRILEANKAHFKGEKNERIDRRTKIYI